MECSICLNQIDDDDATSKTVCGHTFHSKCIFTSIAYKNFSCPNCREKLADCPEKIKENETDEIIRSIIEIHSIPNIFSNELATIEQHEQTGRSYFNGREEMNQNLRFINNHEQIQLLNTRSNIYAPRDFDDINDERIVNNSIRVRRFRRLSPILPPISISNETNNNTTGAITRTIISPPRRENSNILSLLFRSINNNESTDMNEQD